jgi:PAS domain S-box-containing protein
MASKKKTDSIAPQKTEQDFPIVGIGASAGGLDAFKRFLKAIPTDSGMAYVLVQHLDPTHESILPDILSRVTKIPVHEITDDIRLAPNHIYVIPENKILTSTDGILNLTPRNKIKTNAAIDVFFTTLAEVHQNLAVGIVLSGTGGDGTEGLKAIKAYGGITFAQDQASAAYGDMPKSAVDADVVDFILPPEEMPEKLLQMMHTYSGYESIEKNTPKDEEDIFNQIILVLRQSSGVDFTYYKQTTVRRRIARRMVISGKEKLRIYLKFLEKNPQEQSALFNDMLIPVTSFFRDPKIFQTVTQNVFPAVLKNKPSADPIRIWVAGCSTGEEVYSLAISLHLFLEKISGRQIQIFASDISEAAIAKARIGLYRSADIKNIPDTILKNYFTKNIGGYQVNKQIRDMCVFAIHDFLKDPPFAKMDLISCRNVLIYMDTFLQKRALSTFHYALKENGFLLLGKSETTGPAAELFSTFEKDDKIYARKLVPNNFMHYNTDRKEVTLTEKIKKTVKPEVLQNDFRKTAEALLLSKYTPASVVVNDMMDVVHINGVITPFLEVPQGKPTFNLLKMAREGLAFELRNTLHKAKITNASASKEGILVKADGKIIQINVEVLPLNNSVEPHFLILFHKIAIADKKTTSKGKASSDKIVNNEAHQRIEQLENEIALTREDMRAITEDQEAANEELQSANEELLSSSEELQSLNEELETSKEELQSTNEELIIINQEMLDKQEQINSTRQYSDAIIATVRQPLVVLDKNLRIKTINTSFFKKFNITEEEAEGQLIYEIKNQLFDNSQLRSLLEKILPKKTEMNDYEILINLPDNKECTLLLNARHVINESNKEQLILLAMEDITERKTAEQRQEITRIESEEKNKQIEASEKRFSNILSQSLLAVAILKGKEMIVTSANDVILKLWGKGKNVIGKTLIEVLPELIGQPFPKLLDDVYTTGVPFATPEIKAIINRNGIMQESYFNLVYQPYRDVDNTITGITILAIEITDYVLAKKQIEESEKRFSNILSQSLMAVCVLKGRELVINSANESMIEMWGKGKNVIGKTLIEVLPEIKGQSFLKLIDDVYTTGVPFATPEIKAILNRNGKEEECYFNLVYQAFRDVDESVTGIIVFATEITKQVTTQKQIEDSEAKFKALSENIPHMVWTAGPEGNKNFFNKYFLDYTGKTLEELTGNGFREIIFPEDLKKDLVLWHHSLKTGEDFIMEKRIRHHDGTYRWHLSQGIAQKDEQGEIIGWIGSSTDIDEHKIFAKELTEAKILAEVAAGIAEDAQSKAESATLIAEDATKSKQQFLSNMSHEIRTPMNAIIGFTKVILKTEISVKQKEYLEAIKTSGDALVILINDILDLAKVDAGKMIFVETPFKMATSISAMLHLFETKIHEKNLELVKEYDNRIPEVLLGDSVRLHQIILNLVSNAVKFTSRGKIMVGIHMLKEDAKKVTIQFKVQDSGIGIDENKIASIFEKFQQATNETSSLYGGTGLGLAIVKQLVEAQGGTITVKSKKGEGATFSFTLDFLKTKDKANIELGAIQLDSEIKNIHVLVVEDIPLNQLLMRTLLDDFGFKSDFASNGKIAIKKLHSKVYDIVLMDLQMPEMNGFEATQYIRKTMNSQIPIIALTADVTTVDLEKCKTVGMNDYLSKPVDDHLLYSKIAKLLKKPLHKKDVEEKGKEKKKNKIFKYINLDRLHNLTKSKPKLMLEMISAYLEQTPTLIKAMKESLQHKEWNLLQAEAHKMISSFSIVGIDVKYEDISKKIQENASAEKHLDELPELVSQLDVVCMMACKELEEEFSKIKKSQNTDKV